MNRFIGLSMLMLLSSFPVRASMGETHQNGQQWAQSLQPKVQGAVNPRALSDIPRFESASPKETQLDQKGAFQNAINEALATEDFAKDLNEISKKRPRFKLDPKTDPLFRIPENAETKLKIDPKAKTTVMEQSFEKTCEEGGEEVSYECIENRQVIPQVPLKEATLTINHVTFHPNMQSYHIPGRSGGMFRHGSAGSTGTYQNGFVVMLPEAINAFKAVFCPNFVPRDVKTGAVFNIDCAHIESYQINNQPHMSSSNGMLSIVLKQKMRRRFFRIPEPVDKSLNITLKHRTYEGEEIDEWRSNCDPFEDMVAEGLCHYGERILTEGPGTRTIQGYAITKDEWQYKQRYDCQVIKDECAALKAQGCHPLSSRCKEMRKDRCWIYEQRYQCPKGNLGLSQVKSPSASAFCLTGDCQSTDYKANGELLEAISRLAFLKEVQDDLRANKHQMLPIFKGQDMRCTRNCLNFKDCCRRLKGWGVSLGLTDCDKSEKELAQRREKHQCHQVGTHCTKKAFKKCIRKETSFCCFGSRLSRLLQEQGRTQLGVGWGEPDAPNCRGLTVEELSRLDLSNMNFSEVFEDMMRKYKQPDMQSLQRKTQQKIEQNLDQMTQNLRSKATIPQSGKLNADQNSL